MGRAPCCDKSKVKRGPWSPDEDITLKNYVERYGSGGNWIALPHKAGLKRCGKSCRLRWLNYLRPDIKHGGFTEEEDNIILTLYSTMGSRWSVIASHLQGRTDNDVKNHWNTKLKKKYLLAAGKTILKTTTTTNCDITTNNSMDFSSKPSSAFLSEVDTNCSNTNSNSLPYYTMKVNYDHQHNFVPLPVPENNATTAFSTSFSTSQEANSTLFSSQNNNAWWFGNGSTGEDHDGLLMDSGSGFPYDLLNGFDQFQEKTSDQFVYPNLAHSL